MIYSHQMMSHEKGRIYSLSYKKDSRNEISNPQIVDKALLLQGFAIVGTAFLI